MQLKRSAYLAAALATLACGSSTYSIANAAPQPVEETSQAQDAKIARLIEQLGDARYSMRERAQQELIRVGFAAFDALSAAENSEDLEVATQARYLVRLIRVDWTREGDPAPVALILKDYEFRPEAERLQQIKLLAELPDDQGLEWLCRLVRFEQSTILSKQAALLVVNQSPPVDEAAWGKRAKTIAAALDRSARPGAKWLRAYVQAQSDPEGALAQWVQLTAAEKQVLEQNPQQSQHELVTSLLRRQVDLLDRLDRPQATVEVLRQMVAVERGDSKSLQELVEWLSKRQAWSVIDEVATRFSASFEADAGLMYTLAQARKAQGNQPLADEAADKALRLNGDRILDHLLIAIRLMERGLTEWSDCEYRHVIASAGANTDQGLRARLLLSESLHDRELDQQAGDVLKPVVEALDGEVDADKKNVPPLVTRMVAMMRRSPDAVRARMNFFYASYFGSHDQRAKQLEHLNIGLGQDPTDADVLISLFRIPNRTADERKDISERIKKAVDECRMQIAASPEEPTPYNQLAWLVANTEGDFEEAVRMSQKSVDLQRQEDPGKVGGYLDTLGRCYYAKGDLENAVKYQSQANKLDPHTQQISRQLELFKKELAAKQAAEKKN